MIKLVTMLKRKPGLAMEDFIAYYETRHARIGEKYLAPHAVHYVRRFFQPLPGAIVPSSDERPYDMIMEIWFPDQAALEACFADLGKPEAQAEIAEDEAKLFDREWIHSWLVEEHESDLGHR